MTTDLLQSSISLPSELISAIVSREENSMNLVLQHVLNEVMKIERENHINAAHYERTGERQGHANGYKDKTLMMRSGPLSLKVPQVRDSSFYPSSLEKGTRSEQALKLAIAEMYLMGVSTRKVAKITKELIGEEISSTQVSNLTAKLDEQLEKFRTRTLGAYEVLYIDARYEKVRVDGNVIDVAVLIATGINSEGKREILGVSVDLSEAEVHWRKFLQSLTERGMHGVLLIVSDAHTGLRAARKTVFPNVPWQRCLFHYCQNAQAYVPKVEMRGEIAQAIKDIYNCSSKEEAMVKIKMIVEKYKTSASKFSKWLDETADEVMTFFNFDRKMWKKIRSINYLERLNRELKRRTRVVSIFPNEKSLLRLISALLAEQHEDWSTGNRYLTKTIKPTETIVSKVQAKGL